MKYINRALTAFLKFFLVFTGLLTILFLYQIQAVQHGLLPAMQSRDMSQEVILFNILVLIPVATIFMWSQVEKHWPDLHIPTPRIRGYRLLVSITRWRAAFITALFSAVLIELTL